MALTREQFSREWSVMLQQPAQAKKVYFHGMPVAGQGKVSPDFLFPCRRKTANLIDK